LKEIKLCDYGCGNEAKFYFSTVKKWCCSKHQNNCPELRKKLGFPKGNKNPKLSKLMKGKIPWNKGVSGYHIHSEEWKEKISKFIKERPISEETRKN